MNKTSTQNESHAIKNCLEEVENHLGWGPGSAWSTSDFESLGEKILNKTGVHLSIVTLKRLWGRIKYESNPTVTTLNSLVQFIGFENWQSYKQIRSSVDQSNNNTRPQSTSEPNNKDLKPKQNNKTALLFGTVVLGIIATMVLINALPNQPERAAKINPDNFAFKSKKMANSSIPNSVIFEYNASAAREQDTVYIQQSWDERLREQVPIDEKIYTSIYYKPGSYRAKLVINDQIVKEHDLVITTDDWLPIIEREGIPVYFKKDDAISGNGVMSLPKEKFAESDVNLMPEAPYLSYFNIFELDDVLTDNLVFETAVKNEYSEGANICQFTNIEIKFKGGTYFLPLSIPGCVSEIGIWDMDGRLEDPSNLGVDFSEWVNVKLVVRNKKGELFINGNHAYDLNYNFEASKIYGFRYNFQGLGSVKFVKLSNADGKTVYEDQFGS